MGVSTRGVKAPDDERPKLPRSRFSPRLASLPLRLRQLWRETAALRRQRQQERKKGLSKS